MFKMRPGKRFHCASKQPVCSNKSMIVAKGGSSSCANVPPLALTCAHFMFLPDIYCVLMNRFFLHRTALAPSGEECIGTSLCKIAIFVKVMFLILSYLFSYPYKVGFDNNKSVVAQVALKSQFRDNFLTSKRTNVQPLRCDSQRSRLICPRSVVKSGRVRS